MSVYESSITNPKKQLEFYKDLSEQLQKENQRLKELVYKKYYSGDTPYIIDIFDKMNKHRINQLEEVIEEGREYVEELKPHWLGNDLVLKIIDDLLQILDKAKGEDNG